MSGTAPLPAAGEPAVSLRGVSFSYRGVPVLEDVTLDVAADDYLALLGPNGSGKTTLLKIVLGLLAPERGRVRVFGRTPQQAHGLVGYVPQTARFDADFPIRVFDVVAMGRLPRGSLRRLDDADRAAVRGALEDVDAWRLAARPIGALSGGELQRVLIARALAVEPQLLLLDEATASLDEPSGTGVWGLLRGLSQRMAIVLVSHDIGAISRHVGSVACLNRRLFAHPTGELTPEILEATYGCPVELLAHGHPHRVLTPHGGEEDG